MLSRPHIQEKYHVYSDDITALINLIQLRGELVSPSWQIDACRDPEDNRVLEAAIEGVADAIVSGDADLLDMREFETTPTLRVAEFLVRFYILSLMTIDKKANHLQGATVFEISDRHRGNSIAINCR